MNTETQKVDVLAVMDEWIKAFATPPGDVRMNLELREARAVVAKLIEATRELIEHDEPVLRDFGFIYVGKIEKAKRALARVGGAA